MGNSSTKNIKKADNPKGKGKDEKRVIKKTGKKGRSKGIFTRRKPSLLTPVSAPLTLNSFEPVEGGDSLQFDPDDEVVNRLRSQLRGDLETFVLNNVLMTVQFFEQYEREIAYLRSSPTSSVEAERNNRLLQYQKHCVSPDKLHEIASKRVRFRPQHGSRKHCTELLTSPRLLVVQDNVELYEGTDSVDYSSVITGPVYRLSMEDADKRGYVKLRSDDKRRPTYEVIEDRKCDQEATYSRILGDDSTPSPRDSDKITKPMQSEVEIVVEEMPKEESGLSEGQKMMLALHEHIEGAGKRELPSPLNDLSTATTTSDNMTQLQFDNHFTKTNKKKFGPQSVSVRSTHSKSPSTPPTRTERRLSGIIKSSSKTPKFVPPIPIAKLQRQTQLVSAKSMPNLSSDSLMVDPSSNKISLASDSSGYKSGSSSLRTNLSLPNSRGSDVDYGYTTIVGFSTPKPLETQRLGNIPVSSMAIPEECFQAVDVRLIQPAKPGNYIPNTLGQGGKLFETRQYLNSRAYMGNFADVFSEGLSGFLGISSETVDSATMQGHQIFCETLEEGPNLIPYKLKNTIIPTITSTCWPQAAFEWTHRKRKRFLDEDNNVKFTWPTQHMITQIKRFGCHVLPVGFMPCRGENQSRDLEWRLAFPEAERYLESCLSHAQVRCYMFTLGLYKSFMEPINAELGLTTENIRTQLLWQCEKNYLSWPEDRPGETLQKFLGSIYDALKRENLPDYFVTGRNQFESTPRSHMRRIQEKLFRIRENLTMHVLMMVRNLRYLHEDSFYPRLDYKKLYEIMTTEQILTLVNPALARSIPNNQEVAEYEKESEEESLTDLWAEVRKNDPGRQWNKKVYRQIEAEKAVQRLTQEFTRQSVDSIDLSLLPGNIPESMRRQLLLELFIPHFIELARKSNEFRAPKQGLMFLNHAECLAKLLSEEPSNNGVARKLLIQIRSLRESSTVGYEELKSPVKIQSKSSTPMFIPNSYKKVDSPTSKSPPIHELPPIPPSTSKLPVSGPHPQPPAKNQKGLKRLSFMLPKDEPNGNSTIPKVPKSPPAVTATTTAVKPTFDYERTITLTAAVVEESADFDDDCTYF